MFKEKLLKNIPIADNYIASGNLLFKERNNSVIICCHGLAGNQKSYLNLSIRDYIINNNLPFDCFRYDIYSSKENHRSFLDFTLTKQSKDLNYIVNYFKKSYNNIYIISASYSGLATIILNSKEIKKQVLIDPSFIINKFWEVASLKKINNLYISQDKNLPFAINPNLKKEGLKWNQEKAQKYLNAIKSPTLLVLAESIHSNNTMKLTFKNNNRFITS